jgi:NAD dependent epimerase/dehydratase family
MTATPTPGGVRSSPARAGSSGRTWCGVWRNLGWRVFAVVRPGADAWRLGGLDERTTVVSADLARPLPDRVKAQLGGVGVVFHLAASGVHSGPGNAEAVVGVNVLGTLHVLEAARDLGVEHFVHCGSCFEYGTGTRLEETAPLAPTSEYAASKAGGWLLARAFARRHDLSLVSLRPFTVYGPFEARQRLVPYAALKALRRGPGTDGRGAGARLRLRRRRGRRLRGGGDAAGGARRDVQPLHRGRDQGARGGGGAGGDRRGPVAALTGGEALSKDGAVLPVRKPGTR